MAKGTEAGPGFPTFIEEKPVGYHEKPCSIWQRLPYNSTTGGVSPMWLEGREAFMTERMRGMTPERRAYRKQWLQDQILSPREPVDVPELTRELYNPIRRFYRYPGEKLCAYLEPKVGYDIARWTKRIIRNWVWGVFLLYSGSYLALFYINDWRHVKRLTILRNKPVVFPGDPDYPYTSPKSIERAGEDYYDLGFKKSNFFKSEEQIRAEYAAELKAKKIREARMLRS